jgi:cobalt-precorrin 5A hydrolase/precorrin-3B C17-methyltransferase
VLAGGTIRFNGTAPWLTDSALPFSGDGNLSISVSEHQTHGGPAHLVYYPQTLALGIGCERGCAPEEIASLVDATLSEAGLSAAAIALVASLDLKCDEPAVTALEGTLGRPIRFFDAERLEAETPRLANPSETVFRAVGCHGVAEAAALAAAGSDGDLIVEKRKSTRATCAIAKAPHAIKETSVGRGKGRLAVVGLGPGNTIWRTGEAQMLIAQASDIVGYQGYLDLIGGGTRGKTLHAYPLGEETERVDAALSLAAEGKRVALVSSGDPGIYAMAALVFERIDLAIDPEWRWVDVTVAPGISALQAAASRAGAPLGHDFCAISLSDLLTPWAVIEKRLTAAAEGDFVIALYNPASRTRRKQLDRALEILSQHRPETTPVIVARQLGRPDESVAVRDLGVFDPALVDMTTLLMIGSSETRRTAQGWVYTPRGYGDATPARKAVQGKAAKS